MKLLRCRRDCRSKHWRPALSIRGPFTSSPMGTCWGLRAMVRKRRFTGPRTSSPAGYNGSPALKPRTQTASRCCAIPMATAFPSCAPSFSTTSTRRSAWPSLVTIFSSRTSIALARYPYQDGQTSINAAGTKLTDLPGGPIDHHWTKALLASPDGSKLYVGVGSNSNIGENGIGAEYERAAIWEVDVASGAHRIFASGIRNPTGLQWEPETGKLWAIANERDEIGPDLVPDYLTSVKDGGFYGWPYSYYGQHLDPRIMPQRPDLVASAIAPDYALSSHVAPLGLAMSSGTDLPANYRGGAFVGEHGSWDRTPLNGYKVVFVPAAGGMPSGPAQDVVTGFLDANSHARGRPVGLAMDRSGALLIADDVGNTVWRAVGLFHTPA